jgi:hypothetical protein
MRSKPVALIKNQLQNTYMIWYLQESIPRSCSFKYDFEHGKSPQFTGECAQLICILYLLPPRG